MKMRWLALSAFLFLASPAFSQTADYDRYGGSRRVRGSRTGFFHVEFINGRWWFVTPGGHGFLSKGVDHINWHTERPGSPPVPPADPVEWATKTARQLREWNFNTAASWAEPEFAHAGIVYAPVLDLAGAADPDDLWLNRKVFDMYSPASQAAIQESARKRIGDLASNPWVLGYFTDNELRWGAEWKSKESLLEMYLKLPAESPGRRTVEAFLAERGKIIETMTPADKDDFLEKVAAEYGRLTRDAIRKYDKVHLILGCRFAGYAPDAALRGVSKYFDVISYNDYGAKAPLEMLRHMTAVTGKPVMITEFSFKAMDSGLANAKGGGKPVATQMDRADSFERYATDLATLPGFLGYHWFQYFDQPKEGRAIDGENSNYGVVRIDGTPWEALTERMKTVNGRLERVRP